MPRHIAIIQGHPDPKGDRFCHALANSYAKGAEEAGYEVETVPVSELDFPVLRTKEDFETGTVLPSIQQSQQAISQADHLVIFYPLCLGTMPALLKAFFEQVFRYGFALSADENDRMPKGLLTGKTARVVVTMGMPAIIYRWYFGAHSLKSLERNILKLSGIGPIKESLIGMVDESDNKNRRKWLEKMSSLGQKGS
jgi:putative NADPH-quinone reductase